ncbi:hydrogen gas-evolving membrane-bound hydrogenase subunit E [Streptomyces sporangiiformans]|uniref:Sodium:proton antiporter n=1 Tax=Streptomyces sporangiiformans TaxID=2315329 RepID=A0A505DFX8_9ACTN|nr:hydrogen gas-evolving membrane-bound hydrogenase subunit E [Streptomyces sporangiiformans]TPQ18006.1 sodium:proton antiporter [Streptomyces sporangiiformans]
MSRRVRLWLLALGGAGLAALLFAACLELPGFGGDRHPYGERAVRESLARRTANAVSSVNFDQRAFDTMGEMTILFAAVLGTVVLLRQTRDEHRAQPAPAHVAPPVRRYALITLPVALLVGLYVVAHGQLSPGGGFQGGVVAATALHLLYLGADYRALERVRPVGLYEVGDALGTSAYLVLGIAGVLAGTAFLANTLLPYGTFNTLSSGGTVPLLNAAVGMEVACAAVVLLARFLDQAVEIEENAVGTEESGE